MHEAIQYIVDACCQLIGLYPGLELQGCWWLANGKYMLFCMYCLCIWVQLGTVTFNQSVPKAVPKAKTYSAIRALYVCAWKAGVPLWQEPIQIFLCLLPDSILSDRIDCIFMYVGYAKYVCPPVCVIFLFWLQDYQYRQRAARWQFVVRIVHGAMVVVFWLMTHFCTVPFTVVAILMVQELYWSLTYGIQTYLWKNGMRLMLCSHAASTYL